MNARLAAIQVIWSLLAIVEALLLVRFGLKLLAANPAAPFANLIYSASAFFLAPFRAIIPSAHAGASVLEWATLVAVLAYWLAAWGIVRLLSIAPKVTRHTHGYRDEVA
jgi:uncharacterized protein YggT (Ycf19 family)